jgi:tRNA(Arg) A34 adenosine deaminase TadA
MTDADFMALALTAARTAIATGQIPVGCAFTHDDNLLLTAHNTVWADTDPSAHSEMNGLRQAAKKLGRVALTGCTCYCTLEPCPMCLAALHWAKVDRVVYGADIADARTAGFSELTIPATEIARLGHSPIRIEGGLLRDECRKLFDEWFQSGKARTY